MAPANRNTAIRSRDFRVESLESRRLLAQSFALIPNPNAFIGPIYVPPPRGPQAPSGAAVVRKLVSTRSDAIALIDLTLKDNHPQLERGFWTNLSVWATSTPGQINDSRSRVEEIAQVVKKGGKERWQHQNVRANAFTLLDFETAHFESKSPDYIAERLRWFKAIAPDAPLSVFGYPIAPVWNNRDRLASADASEFQQLKQDLRSSIAVLNEQSVITIGCYLLGPSIVDRDLNALQVYVKAMREVCPGKPINALLWGAYHTNWNKPNSLLSDSVMRRYVNFARTYFDGAAVWGPAEDNVKLLSLLSDPANRSRLPAPSASPVSLPIGSVTGSTGDSNPMKDEIGLG